MEAVGCLLNLVVAVCRLASFSMRTVIKRYDRDIDRDFAKKLREFNNRPGPDVAVFWNSTSVVLPGKDVWDPRWEIWMEVTDNSHPDNRYIDKAGDTWHDGRRWRFLNTWKNPDGSFAEMDDRLFRALWWTDGWRTRDHYDETVLSLDRSKREQELQMTRDVAYGVASYWRDYGDDVSQVGPGSTGNWRRSGL